MVNRDAWSYKLGRKARKGAHYVAMGPAAVVVAASYAAQGTKYHAQNMAAGWHEESADLLKAALPYEMKEVTPEIKAEVKAKLDAAEAKVQAAAAKVRERAAKRTAGVAAPVPAEG